jgi:hypothetical protein
MLYDLAILCWVIGFASATVLVIGIATYRFNTDNSFLSLPKLNVYLYM